ncbi:hypothetical protein [Jeotgalibacillus campisalis]|uniref:Small, acid-soluble spore protein Tlp n=1 Tax=Jeotgalibacillus campisalis TaxID=220754 RepID=A0A0C2RL37_9BACL|nr:hypothetical protein [Jeotgalibacillus campisalis]KIL50950.1 hypothetical protein KR50_08310 [Jeotgalibacillus campisalis]
MNKGQQQNGEHRAKIKKMQEMLNNTEQNMKDTEFAIEHADTAAGREKRREKNAMRMEAVEDTRREIEEERSNL